jgi:uncharacterized protein YbaR (Trm112 family)
MRRPTLELLCCPDCHAALSLRDERGDETIDVGDLFCPRCERSFSIRNGIAHFISPQEPERLDHRIARFYDWFSHVYALFTKAAFLPFGGERRARKEVLDRLELNGGRILEVSIGSKRGWSVDLFLGTAEALPFKSESFDNVFHIGGINFFSEKKKAIDEMIRVARPGSRIVIADESERIARLITRIPGFSRSFQGKKVDTSVPVHLVPGTMEETLVDGIWKAHGQYHGYCLEFRKPA